MEGNREIVIARLVAAGQAAIAAGGDVKEEMQRVAEMAYDEGGIEIAKLYRSIQSLSPFEDKSSSLQNLLDMFDEAQQHWQQQRKGRVN